MKEKTKSEFKVIIFISFLVLFLQVFSMYLSTLVETWIIPIPKFIVDEYDIEINLTGLVSDFSNIFFMKEDKVLPSVCIPDESVCYVKVDLIKNENTTIYVYYPKNGTMYYRQIDISW
jgi:hypothetical protein